MKYINALNLLNECVRQDIIKEKEGKVWVYRSDKYKDNNGVYQQAKNKEGWYLVDKDIIAKELMNDSEGQEILIKELDKKGIKFVEKQY